MSVPDSKHLFWDTCIIARWLTETPAEYVKSISQYLQEAARGERKILISTITFAERRAVQQGAWARADAPG